MKKHSKDWKSSIRKESKIISFIFLLKLCYPFTWAKLCLNGKMESFTVNKDMKNT